MSDEPMKKWNEVVRALQPSASSGTIDDCGISPSLGGATIWIIRPATAGDWKPAFHRAIRALAHLTEHIFFVSDYTQGVNVLRDALAATQCELPGLKSIHLPMGEADSVVKSLLARLPADIDVHVNGYCCGTCDLYAYRDVSVCSLVIESAIEGGPTPKSTWGTHDPRAAPHGHAVYSLHLHPNTRHVEVIDELTAAGPVLFDTCGALRRLIDCAMEPTSNLESISVYRSFIADRVDLLAFASQPMEGIREEWTQKMRVLRETCRLRCFHRALRSLVPVALASLRSNAGHTYRDSILQRDMLGEILAFSGIVQPAIAQAADEAGNIFRRFAPMFARRLGQIANSAYARAITEKTEPVKLASSKKRKRESE